MANSCIINIDILKAVIYLVKVYEHAFMGAA